MIINKLLALQERHSGLAKNPGAKTIYLASPWFNDQQADRLMNAYDRLLQNPDIAYIHVPLLNQYQGQVLSSGETDHSDDFKYEWATKTYQADVEAIKGSNLIVAIEDPSDVDTGTSVEIGLGIGMNKPVVAWFDGDLFKTPVNLMESFGVTSYITFPEELVDFNFMSIKTRKFEGAII